MTGFIRKLFGNQREEETGEPTVPIPSRIEQANEEPPAQAPTDGELHTPAPQPDNTLEDYPVKPFENRFEPPQFIAGCAQSVGLQRDHNEDALLMLTSTLTSDHTNLPFGLYIVADGMGGHKHGELASGLAVRAMGSYIVTRLYTPVISVDPESPEESIQEIMHNGVHEAHRAILKRVAGGGTTLTAALILGDQITIAHVGDSRAYILSAEGELHTLTRDHSLVNRLYELGQITAEEAAVHPQRNVLYRALGQGEAFDADVSTAPLPHGGYLLMCSDGLWGVVPEKEIIHLILAAPTPQQACQSLVEAANQAGGPDNITALLIRVPD